MKKIFSVVVLILILLAIPITVFVVKQQQELRQRAAPATTLALTPATNTKNVGDEFAITVALDPGSNQIVAVDLHIAFDPEKLEAISITNSSLFPNIIASGVVGRGTADITVGVSDVKKPVGSAGSVATLRFKTLAPTSSATSIRFSQNTFVGGFEGSTNLLVGSTPANVTISGDANAAGATPTTTLSPTATPSQSATSSATLTPTVTPTLTLTPTSTISANATSSAVTILAPTNAQQSSPLPVLQGKAPPGSSVTITIYSTPKTATVSADANGNWVFTPTNPLEPGQHTVVASITDNGVTQTATTTMTVSSSTPTPTPKMIAENVPTSGNDSFTIGLILIGVLFLAGGFILPHFKLKL